MGLAYARSWAVAGSALAVTVAATVLAAPAQADDTNSDFLSALSSADVGFGDAANAVELGQSVCPMLSEPGATFAKTASTLSGHGGISADLAGLFTSIAIANYCPQMMTNFANGDFSQGIGLLNSIPFVPGLAGLGG